MDGERPVSTPWTLLHLRIHTILIKNANIFYNILHTHLMAMSVQVPRNRARSINEVGDEDNMEES